MNPFAKKLLTALFLGATASFAHAAELRLGIIGLDTSHVTAFTELLNNPAAKEHVPGAKVVAAFKGGSADIPLSIGRVEKFTAELRDKYGVKICDTIERLCAEVDAVLLESVDGRPHLDQARIVIAANKPLFIDKPLAGTLRDALEIFRVANAARVPLFTSSSTRFARNTQAVRAGSLGQVRSAETTGPAKLEPHHPDLYWYGVHGCESLFTVMGAGCESVQRRTTPDGQIELFAFMEAADESKRRGGEPVALAEVLAKAAVAPEAQRPAKPARQWKNGLPADEQYFPIAVWLQDPRNAARYQAAGINLYVGLWGGPTTNQLAELQRAGMSVICGQNRAGLEHKDHPGIVGWMHGDEPDNAQSLGQGKGYGPPILPEKIVADYERIRSADPTRPVLLNLGQGVAWDNYIGRGVRRNHPEDYPEYVKGCDIASFDIYPAVHDKPEVAGKLEFVARGVERLGQWTRGEKTVWNCIECTHISNPQVKATPQQVRAEVWMALIHGSRGLIYFVHQFKPTFKEAALLDDAEMLSAVAGINRRIHELAPVLNSPSILDGATVKSSTEDTPIAWMLKRRGDAAYLFAVNLRNRATRGSFAIRESTLGPWVSATALDESRTIPMRNGELADEFEPYEVHLYELRGAK
jgi:hypothetical protein